MKLNLYGNQPIITPRDPEMPMEAANKNYVDNSILAHANNLSLHLTSDQNTFLDGLTVTAEQVNQLAGISGGIQSQLDAKLSLAGGTMTGALTLAGDPATALEASTKQYTDAADALKVAKAGDTMSGFLTLHANPTSNLHAATKQYVDTGLNSHATDTSLHLTSSQNTFIDGITVSSTEVNYLSGTTSAIQGQLDSKLNLAGGTLTGSLTLAADPASALQPATKQYTDAADATKVAKAGDTMTGLLTLSGAPSSSLHASTKQYVDDTVNTHASDDTKHITSTQNTFLDALSVSASEVNQLSGVSSNVQTQITTKFDKAGGLITGDVTLDTNKTIFVSKIPATGTEVVNKSYVDSLINGQEWKDPVTDINLVSDDVNTPPGSPIVNDVYIIGSSPTGAWAGKAGYAVFWNGSAWVELQARAVAIDDRFGVSLTSATTVGASLTAYDNKIVTITDATPGAIQYSADTVSAGITTLVFDPDSSKFGVSYTYTDEGNWVPTNTSVNLTAGDGLSLSGNILNVNYGSGLELNADTIQVSYETDGGIELSGGNKIQVNLDGSTLSVSSNGIKVADSVIADIADKVSKTGSSTVTGSVTIETAGSLRLNTVPTVAADAVNKGYVDSADSNIQGQVTTLQGTVSTLNADPVTKTYVDTQDATKVAKAGDTMTGLLTLSGDPTSNLHAATKQYVDSGLSGHATDDSLHMTSGQNTFLDGITVSSTVVNYLDGVTSSIQTQLDSKLNLAGGTMTGALALAADPTIALQAATKQYVDAADATKVAKAGDTMTGFLTLSAAPTSNLHAATKQYVDNNLSGHATDDSLHMTSGQNIFLDGITVSSTEVNYLTGVTSDVQTQINSKLNLSGGTLTGALTLAGDPTANLHSATKQYVDTQDALKVAKAGDSMTGFLTLHAAPTSDLHASTKKYVDDTAVTVTGYVDTQDALKVDKAGDTMTGFLTLHSNPTANLHAATKQFVDSSITTLTGYVDTQDTALQGQITTLQGTVGTLNSDPVTKSYVDAADATKLAIAGGTMTGYISLHADPTQAMHPTTKQYVDAIAQGLDTKPEVRLATTANLSATYNNGTFGVNATLTGTVNGALSVDGKTANVGDRILVKNQTLAFQNGDFTVQQVGDAGTPFILKRVELLDESSEIPGSFFYVFDGDTLKGTGWTFTVSNPITFTIGTDDIIVNQFSGVGNMIGGAGLTITGNTIDINTANPARIVVNADNIDLATTGVTPGTYKSVTTDGYGRITGGTNPNTIAGYGITDAQPLDANLTSLSDVTTAGILVRDSSNTLVTKSIIASGVGLTVTNGSGADSGNMTIVSNATNAATANTLVSRDSSGNFSANVITSALSGNATTATTLETSRDFSITGDVTATAVAFNGSANVALATSLTDTGVTAGDYTKVTVDAKGRVSAGSNPNTLDGMGITDAYDKTTVDAKIADLESKLNDLYLFILSRT